MIHYLLHKTLHIFEDIKRSTVGDYLKMLLPPSSPPYKTAVPTNSVGIGVIAYQICSYAFFIIYAIYDNFLNFPNFYYTVTTHSLHAVFNGELAPAGLVFILGGKS